MAFDILPAQVKLEPAIDRWTETETKWTSAITRRFQSGGGKKSRTSSSVRTEVTSQETTKIENLRSIEVEFEISGFYEGEELRNVSFDGVLVDFEGVS